MLKLENVTKYYGDFLAVDDLSFEVKPGEIYGLLGVNGAGKTTTFRMILGLLELTKGKISWNDKPIDYSVTDNMGYLTEERSLLVKLTVKEQCLYYGALKGMSEEDILNKMDILLDKFKIPEYRDKKIKELSKGNQQKIQFITAIINEPKLLILDEPFSGLDPFNIQLFKNEIYRLSKNGSIIIFSSHRMDHVELFCEKLSIIMHGKVVLDGYLKKIKEDYMKKTIIISGDIDIEKIKKIDGVLEVSSNELDYEIKIKDITYVDKVFAGIKNNKITKFIVEEPSLNDIFIEKVGESFEK